MTILAATDVPFWLADTGARQRIAALLTHLHEHFPQTEVFYPDTIDRTARDLLGDAFPGLAVHELPWALKLSRMRRNRFRSIARRLGAKTPPGPLLREQREAFTRLCARIQPRVVLVEYARLAYLLDGLPKPRPATWVDCHDVLALRLERTPQPSPREQAEAASERQRLAAFDHIIAIQPGEADTLRGWFPEKSVLVAGHPAPAVPYAPPTADTPTAAFIGSDARHNRETLVGLLTHAWPAIRTGCGENAKLVIWGEACRFVPEPAPTGIYLRGHAPDLGAVFAEAHILLNPVFTGSGLKIKNVEALGFGRPVVTTPCGAEGLHEAVGRGLVIAESWEEIAEKAAHLLQSPTSSTMAGRDAHAFAAASLSPTAVFGGLVAALEATLSEAAP